MPRRQELTRFLKSVRARLNPGDVGLPQGERRRTPGLRREELAALAGMSVTWYTWFEQGREVQLSAPMLERLSSVLRLSGEEREFLFALAQHRPPPLARDPDETVGPAIQHMLDSLDVPAQVMTENWEVVAWNRMVAKVFRDYGQLPRDQRNLLKILLTSPAYRADECAYREMVKRVTARFKWDYSRTTRLDYFEALIEEMLERSDLFREYWDKSDIVGHFEGLQTVTLPQVGEITFRHSSYTVEEAPTQRLMVFAPIDEASARKLRALAAE